MQSARARFERPALRPRRRLGGACTAALLCLAWHTAVLPQSPAEEPREAALADTRALLAKREYAGALPRAEDYLRLTRDAQRPVDELAQAHVLLGEAQSGLRDYGAAEESIRTAITMIEATSGIVSRKLIRPLAVLAQVYAVQERYAEAADTLTHAIKLTRRTDGLFTLQQLPLVESLVEVQKAAGDEEGVERELRFAILATKQELGPEHPDTLEAVRQLADWYLYVEQYDLARFHYGQLVETFAASETLDLSPDVLVNALVGITRSHRLQYANDPRSLEATAMTIDPTTGRSTPLLTTQQRVSAVKPAQGGEDAAAKALEILHARPEPPADLLFETLVELGDWHITERKPQEAAPYYAQAWALLDPQDARLAILREPRVLVYRPPPAAVRSRRKWAGTIPPREIDFTLTVQPDGRTTDVVAVTPDAPPGQVGQLRRALELAIFSPRIEGGQPTETPEYRITEHWYEVDAEMLKQSDSGTPRRRL